MIAEVEELRRAIASGVLPPEWKLFARVDQLRALPHPRRLRALARLCTELGPEALAALLTSWEFWRRPVQRFPTREELRRFGVVVYTGDFGAGKTRMAMAFLEHLILVGRAEVPRVIAATGADARSLVTHKKTGILRWAKPGVRYLWEASKGWEGELTINGVLLSLCSVEAPKSVLGVGGDVQVLEDPPKWGPTGKAILVNALRSSRERGALTIIPTTRDGLVLVAEVLGVAVERLADVGVLVIDLGGTEANAGNLDENYLRNRASMKAAGTWDPVASTSPWAAVDFSRHRLPTCPPLVGIGVSIDPNKGGSSRPCEVGIVGGGRDARDVLHVRYDRSGVYDGGAQGWPAKAWDLAEQLHREHPNAPFPTFVFESNVGKAYADLLYAEERSRRASRGLPAINVLCRVVLVRADRDKCVRAEAPANVAAQGQVAFADGLHELEGQLRNLTPKGTDSDRADACNHLLTHLGKLGEGAEQVERVQARAAATIAFREVDRGRGEMSRPDFDLDRA